MKAQPEAQDGETPPSNAMELIAHLIRHCRDCPLGGLRANAVPGTGPPDAAIMIVAEGPGEHEDRQGKPFVGPAGKFLDKLLAEAGMDRDDVFITNMIKCRARATGIPKTPNSMPAKNTSTASSSRSSPVSSFLWASSPCNGLCRERPSARRAAG